MALCREPSGTLWCSKEKGCCWGYLDLQGDSDLEEVWSGQGAEGWGRAMRAWELGCWVPASSAFAVGGRVRYYCSAGDTGSTGRDRESLSVSLSVSGWGFSSVQFWPNAWSSTATRWVEEGEVGRATRGECAWGTGMGLQLG